MVSQESNAGSSLLQDMLALEAALAEQSSENAFAFSMSPGGVPVSFFDFVIQGNMGATEPKALEPSWQLSSPLQTTSSEGDGERIRQLIQQIKLCSNAPSAPIVAVLGLLNAGKSSLVSTFLSESNRQRILIGSSNEQGTHRFVLWLPESWRDDARVWGFVQERLRTIFGCESEVLSNDCEEASKQYNDTKPRNYTDENGIVRQRSTIEIPLVATDKELDRWGIALMDCPDVQTGLLPNNGASSIAPENQAMFHEQTQAIADARLKVLATAAPLCSAFLVVLPANAMHDQTVSRLLRVLNDHMPSVQQILAINRVPRRYDTKEIQGEVAKLYGNHSISRHYMAYGFDGPNDRERIPKPPQGYQVPEARTLPLFFRIDTDFANQPPMKIPTEDWLLNIGSQLNRERLFHDTLKSTAQRLQVELGEFLVRCEQQAQKSQIALVEMQQTVANACLDFSLDQSVSVTQPRVRLQASRQIVAQISRSLERTAPWWAMPGRWTTRIAEASKANLASATQWFQLPSWFSGKTESIGRWIRSRWTTGQAGKVVTSDALVGYLQQHDRRGYFQLDDLVQTKGNHGENQRKRIREACQRAIDRFQQESRIELDDAELDQFTQKMWAEMPLSKRLMTGLAPAGVLFAPLVAVIMLPMDFGGSAVLVFASLKELLLAGAAGVGLVMASADTMPKIAESEVAWQQLGDLFAVLCDELGVSRPEIARLPQVAYGSSTRSFVASKIATPSKTVDENSSVCVDPALFLNQQSLMRIHGILGKLSSV